jgi:hypothetical protein
MQSYKFFDPAVLAGKQAGEKKTTLGFMGNYDKAKIPGRIRLS